jgi:hypothetical protein
MCRNIILDGIAHQCTTTGNGIESASYIETMRGCGVTWNSAESMDSDRIAAGKDNMKTLILSALGALLFVGNANAASLSFTTTFSGSAPATAVACSGGVGPFNVPTAAGTVLCHIVVTPSTWTGLITLTQPNAGEFVLTGACGQATGCDLAVGPTAIGAAGTRAFKIDALP